MADDLSLKQQADLCRQLEIATAMAEIFRKRQHLSVRVVAPYGGLHPTCWFDTNPYSDSSLQVIDQARENRVAVESCLAHQLFGARLQLRKVVVMLLDHVADFFTRESRLIHA